MGRQPHTRIMRLWIVGWRRVWVPGLADCLGVVADDPVSRSAAIARASAYFDSGDSWGSCAAGSGTPIHQAPALPPPSSPAVTRAGPPRRDARRTRTPTSKPEPRHPCGPSVAVRGNADGAHRPSQLCTPTVLAARTPVRYAPVDTQRDGLQRDKVTHDETEQKRPASARIRT